MNIVLLEELGIPQEALAAYGDALKAQGHSFAAYAKSTDPAVQLKHAKNADILIIANTPLSGEVIRGCKNLKFIDVAFTGTDHVDLEACKEAGIAVSNAAGYATEAVAELVFAELLGVLRHVPQSQMALRTTGKRNIVRGTQLKDKTLGIVGCGAIGLRTAELAHAFGANILAYKRHITGDEPDYITFVPLDTLLQESDIVSLHVPLTDATRGLINKEAISKMKDGAVLINTARGAVVDSQALAEALNSGKLGGAGIDVFETEPPLPLDHPLLHSNNTIVTPHIAFDSQESMAERADIVFDNVTAFLEGKQKNVVL